MSHVDNELLRRAETGESIPSDGSFDLEALARLKAGESREEVLGRPRRPVTLCEPGPRERECV